MTQSPGDRAAPSDRAGSGELEDLLRAHAPQVLSVLVRRHGQFDACEDAVQEALLAAFRQWPTEGVPESPRAWLVSVASRRLTDAFRSESARQRRELLSVPGEQPPVPTTDDTLTLFFLCAHPALSPTTQAALTLRAVGGLTTAEIAAAFLVPEATMAQRISRAKSRIRGAAFELPLETERSARLQVVLRVLYLIFNEGYVATAGSSLHRADLTAEAIRLTRAVREQMPADGEVAGLLALMLLTEARRPARLGADGELVPLAEQDRLSWDGAMISEGVVLLTATLPVAPLGPYQLQAAIAAVHAEAPSADETDWKQIVALYTLLQRFEPGPMVTLNRAVAVAQVNGPSDGLAILESVRAELDRHHRWHAVRAHLLELAGDAPGAREAYREAARRTLSLPEQRYLTTRASRLL
ncbi:RNA polymerase sigma factor [Cryptosporangium sp. NPDC048952]|uniref:RNA polymerase sigma factor n=1 Tax=Cryptosporangium sp. NPDC048952 TaxID=3363961 RepID=UPI00371A303C